jgi:AcrR family transcriptional regulator
MAHRVDVARIQEELVDAFRFGDEERARALVYQLAAQPRQIRAALEEMFESADGPVRQAAAFGLGVLGGAASAKRLEQQLALEETREDYDGSSVMEVIVQSLGRIKTASARASLIRRLKKLASGKPEQTDVDDITYALWRKRHPDLIPIVRSALEQAPSEVSGRLRALLCLLEKTPEELGTWIMDPAVPLTHKTNVLTVLDEEVPDELLPVLPAFITVANALGDAAAQERGTASNYSDRVFTLLLLYRERLLPALPPESRAELRTVARRLVAAVDANCSLRAVVILQHVGHPEDAALIEAHRPTEPIIAKVFDEAAEALQKLPPR